MKKTVSILCAVLLLVFTVGCGNREDDSDSLDSSASLSEYDSTTIEWEYQEYIADYFSKFDVDPDYVTVVEGLIEPGAYIIEFNFIEDAYAVFGRDLAYIVRYFPDVAEALGMEEYTVNASVSVNGDMVFRYSSSDKFQTALFYDASTEEMHGLLTLDEIMQLYPELYYDIAIDAPSDSASSSAPTSSLLEKADASQYEETIRDYFHWKGVDPYFISVDENSDTPGLIDIDFGFTNDYAQYGKALYFISDLFYDVADKLDIDECTVTITLYINEVPEMSYESVDFCQTALFIDFSTYELYEAVTVDEIMQLYPELYYDISTNA